MKNKPIKLLGLTLACVLTLTSVVVLADGNTQTRRAGRGMEMSAQSNTKMSEMTTEERLSALKERLDEQVAAGKITQEQADEMYAKAESGDFSAMRMGKGAPMQELTDEQKAEMKANMLANLKEKLDEQVTAGTITQEEADAKYAKAESGDFNFMGGKMHRGGQMGKRNNIKSDTTNTDA